MTPLFARQDEARRVSDALGPTHAGDGMWVIQGIRGVGKSAVVTHAIEGWAGPVLRVRGVPWESDIPYGVLRQLLAAAASAPDSATLRATRTAVGAALWDPGCAPGDRPPATAFLDQLTATAEQPIAVVIEDGQWAAFKSLQSLSSLVHLHPDRGTRVLVLVSSDADDIRDETACFLELMSPTTIEIGPLTAAGIAQLSAERGVSLPLLVAGRLVEHTGGRARRVVELLREAPPATWDPTARQLPASRAVARSVTAAWETLTAEARGLVEAAAVLGTRVGLADVTAMTGEDGLMSAVEQAERAGLLRSVELSGGWSLCFDDPMVRAAVLESIGPMARAQLHDRAGEVLADPVDRLRHRAAATVTPDARLAGELQAAAEEAGTEGAWAEAAELLLLASRLTREEPSRQERLLRAMDALVGSGDAPAASALVPEVESFRETPLRNAVLGYLAVVRGRAAEAGTRLDRAWEIVNVGRDPEVAALSCQRQVLHALGRGEAADLVLWADRAVGLVAADAPAAVEAQAIRGLGVAGMGDTQAGLAAYRELVAGTPHGAQVQRVLMGRG